MANSRFQLILLLLSILFKVNHTQESVNYFGTLIGSFSRIAHGLSGDVYAIDSTTLWIRNFNYDGAGPDAFFWGGTTGTSANSGGEIIPDETGSTNKLKGYTNANIIINLPDGRVITDYKWISVWCRRFTSNFGEVDIPSDFVAPSAHSLGVLGFIPRVHYVRADDVIILDTQTLRFKNLDYDGTGPAAYFWVGSGSTPNSLGYRIPDETGSETKIKGYNGADITITLPGDLTVFDIGYISLWCEAFFQDFGHVDIPSRSTLSVPPRISEIQQITPSSSPSPAVPSLENCEQLSDVFQVHWRIRGLSIDFELKGRIETDNYMAFGLSGSSTRTSMIGSDVTVAWFDGTEGQAVDYNINSYSQCSGGFGACPDTLSSDVGVNSVTDVQGSVEDGVTTIAFTRLLDTGDLSDSVILTDSSVYISWALGRINPDGLAVKHATRTPTSGNSNGMTINFGRSPSNTCTSLISEGTPKPPPEPWAPNKIAATTTEFDIKIGPSGGERGYTAITGKAGWGIALYVNGLLIPELTVQRGSNYTFRVFGGADPSLPAAYHPVYITNDDAGGLASLVPNEIKGDLEIYAGPINGSLCEYVIMGVDQSETINTFDEYFQTLTEECVRPIEPSVFIWTPDENTPDLVYYQCYTHRYLGWKIHVEDQAGNTEEPSATGSTRTTAEDDTTTSSSHRIRATHAAILLIVFIVCILFV